MKRLVTFAIAMTFASVARADDEASPSPPSAMIARLSTVGVYRRLYDLDVYGGGLQAAFGARDGLHTFLLNVRALDQRTTDGLVALEGAAFLTVDRDLGAGWHAGVGAGVFFLDVWRRTAQPPLMSAGPSGRFQYGYDFGARPNLFIDAAFDLQVLAEVVMWGPTLDVGVRF